MKTYRKILAVIMCVVITLSAAPLGGLVGLELPSLFGFEADAATYSGACGDNLMWSYDVSTGALNISGFGEMYSYSSGSSDSPTPWYSYCSYIKTVNLPNSITTIGEYAFNNCSQLTSIKIPDSVSTIGNFAFYNCDGFTNIKIPDDVTTIGAYAFAYCNKLSSVIIGNSLTTIGGYAFAYCSNLTNVIFGNSVIAIGNNAFRECRNLTDITIGNNVTTIGDYAFCDCNNLTNITIPYTVKEIGYKTFSYCTKLSDVYFVGSSKEWQNIDIGFDNKYLTSATRHYVYFNIVWIFSDNIIEERIKVGDSIVAPTNPENEGYTFIGWDSEIPSTMPEKDLTFTAQWQINNYDITWVVDGVETKQTYMYGAEITALEAPSKDGYTFIGWSRDIPSTMPAENITITAQWKANTYTVTWNLDGKTVIDNIDCDDVINIPSNTSKVGYKFIGWDKTVPSVMPSENLEFTAQYKLLVKELKIKNLSVTTINYGETLVLHADFGGVELPEGWSIQWAIEGNGFDMSPAADGLTCKVTSVVSGNATVKATLVDENGEAVLDSDGNEMSDSQQLTSKAGFFQKLISFFKNLFGISRIILQSFDY